MELDQLPEDIRMALLRSLAAGEDVHESAVKSRVQAALEAARLPTMGPSEERLLGKGVVLFLDLDGPCHPQGASRIDDQGMVTGEGLFRWWPQLKTVLDDYPDVQVVVHSSWGRLFGPLPFLKPLLPADLARRVVDITSMDEPRRGHAVQEWVDSHAAELGAYVVLDDQADSFAPHVPLVCCDPQRGLSAPAVVQQLRFALECATHRVLRA